MKPSNLPSRKRRARLPFLLIATGCALLCGSGVSVAPAGPLGQAAPRIIQVRDFGALADGKGDSGPGIRAAIRAATLSGGGTEVRLDSGEYRVGPAAPGEPCFTIHQATNLVVCGVGTATRFIITDPAACAFSFSLCHNVGIRDLAIDYDPLPFCQGRVQAVDLQAGFFDLELESGYPTPDAENFLKAIEPYGKWGMIMDPATRRIRSGTPDHYMTPRWEHRSGRIWRFFTAEEHYRKNLTHMRVGDAYVHLARGHGSAVFAQGCSDIRIENVMVHASPGLSVGLVGNRGEIRVRGLEVRFAPGTTRLLTANADGVHCQQNRSGPTLENCYFEGMADDAVNIYTPPNVLREVRSPTQWLVSPGAVILPGDRLQVLDPKTGCVRGEVKVASGKVEQRAFLIDLDRPFEGAVAGSDHRTADTLYNLDACGAGFQIRSNYMKGNRRYGCLLRAGGGVVEDNTFEDTTGAGVVLTNEPDWPEGPVPWDILIRRNRFLRGGTCLGYADSPQGAALSIRATRLGHGLAETEAIRNVTIENNEFRNRAGTAIFVGGASQVTLRSNNVSSTTDAELRSKGPDIRVERSSGVLIQDNTVSDPRPGVTAAVEVGSGVPVDGSGVRVTGLNATLAAGTRQVIGRPAGRVRLVGHSLVDDNGPFLGLGASYFTALWRCRNDRIQLSQDLSFLAKQGFSYYRMLSMVGWHPAWESLEIAPVSFKNRAGRDVEAWPDYWQQLSRLIDVAFDEHGLRTQITIFADAQLMPEKAARLAHLEKLLTQVVPGREHKIMLLEVANEAWQNGFPGDQGISDLRELARYLNAHTDIPVAITSNHDMASGFEKTYGGSNADLATWHFSRDRSIDDGWRPVYDCWAVGERAGFPPVISNEPIGPGSSVASENDVVRLVTAAAFAYVAKLPAYVFHCKAGGFGKNRFEDTPGITGFGSLFGLMPPDLPNWERFEGKSQEAPLRIFADGQLDKYWSDVPAALDGCLRNAGCRKDGRFVCVPIGIRPGGLEVEARHSLEFTAYDPLTGRAESCASMKTGDRIRLPTGPGALLVLGQLH